MGRRFLRASCCGCQLYTLVRCWSLCLVAPPRCVRRPSVHCLFRFQRGKLQGSEPAPWIGYRVWRSVSNHLCARRGLCPGRAEACCFWLWRWNPCGHARNPGIRASRGEPLFRGDGVVREYAPGLEARLHLAGVRPVFQLGRSRCALQPKDCARAPLLRDLK